MGALFDILMAIVVAFAAASSSMFGLVLDADLGRPAAESPRSVKRSAVAAAPEALAVSVVRR